MKRINRILAAMLAAVVVSMQPFYVFADDIDFFADNDILLYDPNGCVVENQYGDIALEGTDNAEKIFRFLTGTNFTGMGGKPFNALQAAGALGNFHQESGMDPSAIDSNGEGHGLAQWSYARKTQLFALAAKEGKPWDDLGLQILMMQNEINSPYGKMLLDKGFGSVSKPEEASFIFQVVYEGAGVPMQEVRDKAAAAYYEMFKDLAPSTSVTPCKTGSSSDQYTLDGNFIVYSQVDPRWANHAYSSSTLGKSGCGPTSLAMIITAMTGTQVLPPEVGDYAASLGMYIPGAGSSWMITEKVVPKWGLKATKLPADVVTLNNFMKAGGMLEMAGTGAEPFSPGGHFIMIRGVLDNGKWKIGDSSGIPGFENSKKEWDPNLVLSIAAEGSIYGVSK